MTLESGARTQLISFERGTASSDDYGGEDLSWQEIAQAFAQVRFGTGQERRSAAQEGNEQAATFGVLRTPTLDSVNGKDRIQYMGFAWDITAWNPTADGRGIVFTATRKS